MLFISAIIVIAFISLKAVSSDMNTNNYYHIYQQNERYRGEKFPQKYLSTDGVQPTMADLSHYVKSLYRVVDYFASQPNDTDPNVAIGTYLMKAVLKRTLIDYSDKIKNEELLMIKDIINKAEVVVSHFVYNNNFKYEPDDLAYKLSRLFTYDDSLVYSIGKFHQNMLTKWINSNIAINEFIEAFDNITYPKEKYASLVINMNDYYLIPDSDLCISRISTHPMPLKTNAELKPCYRDKFCEGNVLKMPSVAYALSHRLLYMVILAHARRCYIISEEADRMHMDIMCANMYRETVYLARRGFFYRDLFMEHIALCALLGYEEFHRHNWFQKSASWVDEDGCMVENYNFEFNRTLLYVARANTSREAKALRKLRNIHMNEECQLHQMALVVNVLAYGIRHAAHFMKTAP